MATKGRGGTGTWPVFEDFKPNSEWQQDAHSHNLIVFLPGFMKEQLRVSTEGLNTIRVRGERLLAGNKWSRFLEDYEVPENSDMNSVRAKFHEGSLTITIPKKTVDKIHDFAPEKKGAETSTHLEKQGPPAHDDQTKESGQTGMWRAEDEKKNEAKEERKPERSKESGEDEKIIRPRRDDRAAVKEKGKEGKQEEIIESGRAEHGVKEKGKEGKMKEVTESSRTEHRVKEKGKEGKKKEVVDSGRAEDGALAKAMKGVSELSEERRLMVNMGAAVLVIAAFSAYVTYKFVARDDNK